MKTYKIETITAWFTSRLTAQVKKLLEESTSRGWEIVSVSFGINVWCMPTAYVTFLQPAG